MLDEVGWNPEQFVEVISLLKDIKTDLLKPNWLDLITQFLASLTAAGVAWWASYSLQKRILKQEEINLKIQEANKFNEAVVYLGNITENAITLAGDLLIREYENEKNLISHPGKRGHLYSIQEIPDIRESMFISKIPNVGEYIEPMQAFLRLRYEISRFNTITKERTFLANALIEDMRTFLDNESIIMTRLQETHQRTVCLLVSIEKIIDCTLYLSEKINDIAIDIKNILKEKGIQKRKIAQLTKNDLHYALFEQIFSIIENDNLDSKTRHLHLKTSHAQR